MAERLHMAGYDGDTSQEAVEALITETFGMPTVSYLLSCEPDLLPSLEDLQAQYDSSGTYQTSDGILTRQSDSGSLLRAKSERYIRKDSTLILTEEADPAALGYFTDDYPMIYTLQQSNELQSPF